MKKAMIQVLAVAAVLGSAFQARAQAHKRLVCKGRGIRVEVQVCPQGQAAPLRATVPPPVAAPAVAPVVPPALVAPRPVVVKKPLKKFTVRVGLGLDVFPLDFSLRLSRHLAWSTSGLIFGVGGADDGVIIGGLLTGFDWYFGKRVFDGLHIGVRGGFLSFHERGEYADTYTMGMARAGIGYDWVFDDFVTLGIEGGIHYTRVGLGDHDSLHLILPYLRLSGGFVF